MGMTLQDWVDTYVDTDALQKAGPHKYTKKTPDGKGGWNYEYADDAKKTESGGSEKPAAEKPKMSKQEAEAALSTHAKELGSAVDKQDRKAAVEAMRAIIEVAKAPGMKAKAKQALDVELKSARSYAKTMVGRVEADRRRSTPVTGRDPWTFEHLGTARAIRDNIEKAKSIVSKVGQTKEQGEKKAAAGVQKSIQYREKKLADPTRRIKGFLEGASTPAILLAGAARDSFAVHDELSKLHKQTGDDSKAAEHAQKAEMAKQALSGLRGGGNTVSAEASGALRQLVGAAEVPKPVDKNQLDLFGKSFNEVDFWIQEVGEMSLDDFLEKAGPHKYTSKKQVGGKWVYEYKDSATAIGKTKSGKSVHMAEPGKAHKNAPHHQDFTEEDHRDAAKLHDKAAWDLNTPDKRKHAEAADDAANYHRAMATAAKHHAKHQEHMAAMYSASGDMLIHHGVEAQDNAKKRDHALKIAGNATAAKHHAKYQEHMSAMHSASGDMLIHHGVEAQDNAKKRDNALRAAGAPLKKGDSMDPLNDWLQKSTGDLPTGEPKMPTGLEADNATEGGKLEGKGKTAESQGSSSGPEVGAPSCKEEKLSEDDETTEQQLKGREPGMIEQNPPIQKGYTQQEWEHEVRYERDMALRKAERDVYLENNARFEVGAIEPIPAPPQEFQKSYVNKGLVILETSGADAHACDLLKGDRFYQDDAPALGETPMLHRGALCKSESCGCTYPAFLTACPECGYGTVMNRALPPEVGAGYLEKAEGSQLRLRDPEPDLKFADGLPLSDD